VKIKNVVLSLAIMTERNLFVALEGIDGSGKSTQAKLLSAKLEAAGHKVYTTFEPSDGVVGTMVRSILKGSIKADNRTIAALFLADRLDHLLNETNGLLKKLSEGYIVITDRYYFSSYAYHGTHMDMGWVIACNKMCADILRPDINVFIDLPPAVSMQRINANRQSIELYETLDNLTNVRGKYMEAFALLKDEEQLFITDGNRTPDVIAADIWAEVNRRLK
jgi:dTMP kinase